jgi:hypothetical protein
MKKIKLFLAAVAAMVGLSAQAQSGTASEVGAGNFMLFNVGTGEYLTRGNGWGTQASITTTGTTGNGIAVTLEAVGSNYKIRTDINGSGKGLENLSGGTVYLDQSSGKNSTWTFTEVATDNGPVYTIVSADNHGGGAGAYLTAGANGTIVTPGTDGTIAGAQWKLMAIPAEPVGVANASVDNPVDVTSYIINANFSFDAINKGEGWTMNSTNYNACGGNVSGANVIYNPCAESWRAAFTLSQALTVPNGKYQLTAQAAVTEYTATGADMPVVYANDVTAPFKAMAHSEGSMGGVATQFTAGEYVVGPIEVTVTNGTLTIGVRGTRTDTWCVWDNFKLTYLGLDLSELKTALQAQIDAVPALEGTTTTAAYTAAKEYADGINVSSLNTEEAISNASSELATRVDAAKALQSAYAGYLTCRDAVDALDDDATVYSGDATVDLTAIDATVNATTTLDALNAAIETAKPQLQAAAAEFLSSVSLNEGKRFDITNIYLTNPDFEIPTASGVLPPGWTITITGQNCGQQNRTDTNPETGLAITNFIEAWHPSQLGNGVIAQTVSSLPEGTYVLECDASICHDPAGADDITGANLFVQSSLKKETQAISNVRLYINHYTVSFSHGGSGSVTFGLEANNTNANWLSADNFKVYYAGGVDLSVYEEALAEAVAAFEALEASADAADYATYKAIVDENNIEWSTSAEYQAAIDAVNGAASDLSALIPAKAAFNAAVAAANEAKAANANVTGSELTALDAAIAATPGTTAEYTAATETLTAATTTFTAAAPSYNKYVAYKAETIALFGEELAATVAAPNTAAEAEVAFQNLNIAQYNKVAADYTYSLNGLIGDFGSWTGTATVAGVAATPNYYDWEHWSGDYHAYYEQAAAGWGNANGWTIKYEKTTTLPAGEYVIKVAARTSAGTTSSVSCSATDVTISLPNFASPGRGINTSGVASWSDSDTFSNGDISRPENAPTVGGTGTGWQWRFLPFTLTEETEVTMTFYAEATTQYQWMSIADGELLSATDIATAVAFDEAEDNEINGVQVANVTMNRNIKEGFNTVVLPFTLTANQVTAAFGAGTEVYNFSENSTDANDITINFDKGDGSITANVPVLVKATAASESQVFKGVQVVAAEAAMVEGKNANFVGVYAPATVAEGDYFIGNGAVYKSKGETNIKAFRAYIDVDNAVAGEVKLFIDGITTGISEINGEAQTEQGAIYTLAGQRVSRAQKGIYIVNGKKVAVK